MPLSDYEEGRRVGREEHARELAESIVSGEVDFERRERIATAVLQSLISAAPSFPPRRAVALARAYADALIVELAKPKTIPPRRDLTQEDCDRAEQEAISRYLATSRKM